MKEIKATIKPFRLEQVVNALHQIKGLPAVTIASSTHKTLANLITPATKTQATRYFKLYCRHYLPVRHRAQEHSARLTVE